MKNKFELQRTIPSDIKLAVRQKCGFGCVICGDAIIQYHHFDPPFSDAQTHSVEGITLLCGKHHDMVHKNIISIKRIKEADISPYCKNESTAKSTLFMGNILLPVKLGSSSIHAAAILMYDNDIILGFMPPEKYGAPVRLNAIFTDNVGNETLRIINNEWVVGSDCFDVEITKSQLKIKKSSGEITLEMNLSVENSIQINRLDMNYKGFNIIATENSFRLKVPNGSQLNHNGNNFSEIGIWMKSDGSALVAVNKYGGAAIKMG